MAGERVVRLRGDGPFRWLVASHSLVGTVDPLLLLALPWAAAPDWNDAKYGYPRLPMPALPSQNCLGAPRLPLIAYARQVPLSPP
jgi:hypothetical protein